MHDTLKVLGASNHTDAERSKLDYMRKTGRDISLFADPAFNKSNVMFTMEPIPFPPELY